MNDPNNIGGAQPPAGQPIAGQAPEGQPIPQANNQAYENAYGVGSQQSAPQTPTSAVNGTYQTYQTPPQGAPYGVQGQPIHTPDAAYPAGVATGAAHAKKRSNSSGKTFLIAFAGALVACILAFGIMSVVGNFGTSSSSVTLGNTEIANIQGSDVESTLAEAVATECLPSVASIQVYSTQQSSNNMYDYLFGYGSNGMDNSEMESGLGSGVMLSEDGYLITNNHVVAGGTKFSVTVAGDTYDATLIGQDASSDVAVLKIDGTGFDPIAIGDSDNIKIGEWVMSIGSPFGLEQSVATGIVSATSRSQIMDSSEYYGQGSTGSSGVTIYPNMIQTDAAINPGNSGGALVNANGQLIGINTLITSYSGNYSGVGFAIPINYAISIAQSLIAGEEPTHAQLGVNLSTVNSQIASRYGFSVNEGAYVSTVVENSPAAKAGIEQGDIIIGFDGEAVTSASDLMLDVRTKNPGDTVTLRVNRDGKESNIDVVLGSSTNTKS